MSMNLNRTTPRRLLILAALALAGIGASVFMTQHYYDLRSGSAAFKSFCNLGQTMNCDTVTASSYADFIGGFPLSSFAAGWFLALFVVALVARNPFWRREAVRAAFLLTSIGTVLSILYFWVMASVLHTYCLFCLITDGINIFSLAIVLSLKPEGFSQHKPEWAKWKPLLGTTLAAVLIAVLGLKSLEAANLPAGEVEEMVNSNLSSPVVSVSAGPEFPSFGPANAPITIVEFSDFQCPFCRIAALNMHAVLKQHPTQVRLVFRNFPLDAACNREIKRPMHQFACEAAKSAICARNQGKFEAVYESYFENQSTFAPGRAAELAKEAGADPQQLASCVTSADATTAVARDIEEALTLGVVSTPTFFINGHKIEGAPPPTVWAKMIQRLLHTSR